jgi:CBS domain containing-hemolysin-like protein
LHELEKLVGEVGRGEGAATASGWITHRLGGFPKVGDVLTLGACELRVEEMDGPRVARFKITRRQDLEDTTFTTRPRESQKPP